MKGKKISALILMLVLLSCMVLPSSAYEFSWNQAAKDWELHESKSEVYMLPIRDGEDSWAGFDRCPKRLRPAISEDWVIQTHISACSEPEGSGYHVGLIVYKDADNWMAWGVESGNATVANGVLGGNGYDIEGVYERYEYLRLTKKGNLYTFSCSPDGVHWVDLAGKYDDIHGFLEGAQYGLFGKNWEITADYTPTYYVMFDSFTEAGA